MEEHLLGAFFFLSNEEHYMLKFLLRKCDTQKEQTLT